jgi:multidrug resistance protein, MATE family
MPTSWKPEARRLWALAWPVAMSQLVWIILNLTDTAMVGQAATAELAYMNAARIITWLAWSIPFGLLTGVMVFTARHYGAGEDAKCGEVLHQGLLYAALLGLIVAAVQMLLARPVLQAFGLPADQVEGGSEFVQVMALGTLFGLLGSTSFHFLEGLSRPRPGMIILLSALPMNVFLNWVFIYGELGAPAMGATGAALGTVLAQAFSLLLFILYFSQMRERVRFGVAGFFRRAIRPAWANARELRRFGYVPGMAAALEMMGFNVLSILAGRLGDASAASLQILGALHMLSLTASLGVASAAAVRVGNAVGEGADWDEILFRVRIALGLATLSLLPFAIAYAFLDHWVVLPFTSDAAVADLAGRMMFLVGLFLVFDGWQFVLLNSLRAAGDQKVAGYMQITAFFGVMGVGGYILVEVMQLGPMGVAIGFVASLPVAAVLMGGRLWWLWRRRAPVLRPEAGQTA